jgi:carbonic anhydrase
MLGGVSAAVEYAVSALGVTDIVVCGHTDCGAMKALEDPAGNRVDEMPTVRSWLTNAAPALAAARAIEAEGHRHDTLRLLVEQNVLLQIANLRTHPSVANAVAAGRLFVHGWVYDIEHGEIAVTDEATGGTETIEAAKARLGL